MNREQRRKAIKNSTKVSDQVQTKLKDIKLAKDEMAVLQDYQLAINHLNEAMGRYLGHIGVKNYGLIEGKNYGFEPKWLEGIIEVYEVKTKPKLAK